MRNTLPILVLLIVAPFSTGCQSNSAPTDAAQGQAPSPPPAAEVPDRPVAYLDGKPVTQAQLYRELAPAYGGEALAEILLNRAVEARLKQEAIELTQDDLDRERDKLLTSLAADADQAARLLQAMRAERGLNQDRFATMLRRSAGLRRLVRDQVQVSEVAIAQAYQLRYDNRYQVRLITSDSLDTITRVRRQALGGTPFMDLAIEHSTDSSASQGGLLSPISHVDPTYPKAVREVLPRLAMNNRATRLSPAIALESGYALLWLEGVVERAKPELQTVRPLLEAAVRAEIEQLRMRQLARTLIEGANVIVLDPELNQAWGRQRDAVDRP